MAAIARKKQRINISGRSATTKGDIVFYIVMLIIPLTQIGIFYFGVNFQSILMSFQVYSNSTNEFTWNVSHNIALLQQDISNSWFWIMIKDSLIVWLVSQFAGTVLALFFSYYIYKRHRLYNFFKFILFLPSIIPGLLLVLIFQFFMNSAVPAFIKILTDAEKVDGLLTNPDTYFWIITIYTTWVGFGAQVLVYSGAMEQIPQEMIEAGKLDGASSFREFVSLVVPTILPTITTFLIAGVATIFTNQNSLYSFFGGEVIGQDRTIGYYLYILISAPGSGMANYCYASFLGLISTFVAIPLTFIVRKALSRVNR